MRTFSTCLLLWLIISACNSHQPESGPEGMDQGTVSPALRVMSFNIRFDNPDDGPNVWEYRRHMVVSTIRFHEVHLAGLQEALKSQMDDLTEALPEYHWLGVGRDDGWEAGEFCPVFYRKDRLQPLIQGTFWLSETPDIPGTIGWDAACNRIVTWGRFQDRVTGDTICVLNTHFDHIGQTARRESAKLLIDRIEEIGAAWPVIISGDFNATEGSEIYQILTGGGGRRGQGKRMVDAFRASEQAHHGPAATFTGFRPEHDGRRIDYIFVSPGVRVLKHAILAERWGNRWPSDHFPVFAVLRIP